MLGGGVITIFAPMAKAMVLAKSLKVMVLAKSLYYNRESGLVALFQDSLVHTNAGCSVFLEMSNTSINKVCKSSHVG